MRWYDRLRRSSEIVQVRRKGVRAAAPSFALFALPGGEGRVRVGVTVSKAVGGAVTRNLVRRRILGALDGMAERPSSGRLLFVARPSAAAEPYARLAADVAGALIRARGTGG